MVHPAGGVEETGLRWPRMKSCLGPSGAGPRTARVAVGVGATPGGCPTAGAGRGFPLEEADFLQNKGGTLLCRSGDPGRGWGKERQGAGEAA